MNEVNAFLDGILKWAIPLVLAGVVGWVAVQLVQPIKTWFEANMDVERRHLIEMVIAQVVRTAEATRLKAKLEQQAFDALRWALAEAKTLLNGYGISIDDEGIANLIRAELHRLLDSTEGQPGTSITSTRSLSLPDKNALRERLWA
jgi:hypothetical protein